MNVLTKNCHRKHCNNLALRNALREDISPAPSIGLVGQDVILIGLARPLMYVQPSAVDRAILVWLNYKNAYDYWTEQRANLNKEVLMATQKVSQSSAAFFVSSKVISSKLQSYKVKL